MSYIKNFLSYFVRLTKKELNIELTPGEYGRLQQDLKGKAQLGVYVVPNKKESMSKLTALDKETMVKHLRELNKLSLTANSENSKNIQKQINHTIVLTNMMLEDRAKIKRLNNVIDIKQREIDELNSKNMDLLWEAKLKWKRN
jgi:hypothetical protein